MMATTNLGWYFYKKYYSQITNSNPGDFLNKSTYMINSRLPTIGSAGIESLPKYNQFDLTTTYPGLLIGSGYQHESGGDNEFKIGFFFDYTSGLPLIPGSSVKGMLKSCFPIRKIKEKQQEKLEFIKELAEKISSLTISNDKVFELCEEIFEGEIINDKQKYKVPIYDRDLFMDGVISPSNYANKKFMGSDYITPHKNPLQDPLPIMFIKVLPEIVFRFQFVLHDSKSVAGFTAKHKEALFKELILQFGIGAKTNVGYGQFTTDIPIQKSDTNEMYAELMGDLPKAVQQQVLPDDYIHVNANEKLKSGKVFDGKIVGIDEDNKNFTVSFKVEGVLEECSIVRKKFKKDKEKSMDLSLLKLESQVKVKINSDYIFGNTLNCTILLNT